MSHRKLDVDALHLDDDDYQDLDALASAKVDLADIQDAAQSRATEVASLLARGDLTAALRRALQGTQPYGPASNPAITPYKDLSTKAVVDVLTTARSTDVPSLIAQLQPAELDLLFKYVYRAMATPALYNCGSLLAWHEKLTEVAGVGAIVRVMADKRAI